MKRNLILALIISLVLAVPLSVVSSYSLPDVDPVITFTVSGSGSVAVLTAVAVDTLSNAGIARIEIYQDSSLLDSKECGSATCTFVKTINENKDISHSYFAKAADLAGHSVSSEIKEITFSQINIPPVIGEADIAIKVADAAYIWYVGEEDITITAGRVLTFSVEIYELNNDQLSYEWLLNSALQSTDSSFTYTFNSAGEYTIKLIVKDSAGGTDTKEFGITVLNPTVYGTVYDVDTGSPLSNINISFYSASIYDVDNDSGNYSALQPKPIPDTVTDSNGNYSASLEAGIWHMVIQGSDEKDFNIYAEAGKKKKHDSEVDHDRPETNFNAEGHILHSGQYEHTNNYTCGDSVNFVMFGVNNGASNETITFLVQNHTVIGGPTAPIVYTGNISDENESLMVPAGEKKHKQLSFEIPCSYNPGRYDIHVVWNGTMWHKIGNFFVIEDTIPPLVWFDSCMFNMTEACPVYNGENASIIYHTVDQGQPGTIRILIIDYEQPSTLDIAVDNNTAVDSDNDTITDNDIDIAPTAEWATLNITYNGSGHYQIKINATDKAGNWNSTTINVTVWATESEVDAIADVVYPQFGYGVTPLNPSKDALFVTSVTNTNQMALTCDRIDAIFEVGDEYIAANGFNESNYSKSDVEVTEEFNDVTYPATCNGPEYIKGIFPMTADEYNYTLNSFLFLLQCRCKDAIDYGPACNSTNFVPEIWTCNPSSASWACKPVDLNISSTSSQAFSVSAVDPNNDAITYYWYVDDELKGNTSSYTFVANISLIGDHIIKAVALDATGENKTIVDLYGAYASISNSFEWNLTVTE